MKTVCLIKYIGGKAKMLGYLFKTFDYSKESFVDVFGGAGNVVLNVPYFRNKMYNDINDEMYNLFFVIKNNYDEFMQAIELPHSEKLFYEFITKRENKNYKDNIEKAVCVFYLITNSFSGNGNSLHLSYIKKSFAKEYKNKQRVISEVYERLKEITLLNKDCFELLELTKDKKTVMLYCDPPYYSTEHYYRANKKSGFDHYKLAEKLNEQAGSVCLSYYYFDGIEDLYPRNKWKYFEISTVKLSARVKTGGAKPKATELIITNYDLPNNLFEQFKKQNI